MLIMLLYILHCSCNSCCRQQRAEILVKWDTKAPHSPAHVQLWTGSWRGSRVGWWRRQHTDQRSALPGKQTGSAESHCGTDYPSSHSTCPCHGLLSVKIKKKSYIWFSSKLAGTEPANIQTWVQHTTLIRLWSELMSGLSLLLLSKCL